MRRRPQWMLAAAACFAMTLALALESPAVGIVIFAYAVATVLMLQRQRDRREAARRRSASFDLLATAAADLRSAASPRFVVLPDPELDRLAQAGQRLSDRTGAPLAQVLQRLETSHHALARAEAAAHSQAAGIRATTMLLILLPVVALALGYAMGADGLKVLLGTPLGTACAAIAVALQLCGLVWADRLAGQGWPRLRAKRGLARLRTSSDRKLDGAGALELATAADLIAAALQTGAPTSAAVIATADVLGGPLSARLFRVGHALRLGVTPARAWQELEEIQGAQGLLHSVARSAESGAALSGALTRCADDLRARIMDERHARLQRRAVLLVLPLGGCFLPAFLLAGLVPVVLAVLGEVL